MKKLLTFLMIAYVAISSPCYSQKDYLSKDGLVLQYKKLDKMGSRYDEYCKVTFDIYPVEGIVINNNVDKAAMVNAILGFEGQECNKIYSNDGPTGGEVINKKFILDIAGQTDHKTQYWVNRFVHLLPNDRMMAKGIVEVKQDGQVPDPQPYFTYELIPRQGNGSGSQSAEESTENKPVMERPVSTDDSGSKSLILGEWQIIREVVVYTDGTERERGELFQTYLFKSDGSGTDFGNGEQFDFKYTISGDKINWLYSDGGSSSDIVKLDNSILVIKFSVDDDKYGINYWVSTYKKVEK